MIDRDIERQLLANIQRRWPGLTSWIIVILVALATAVFLVIPDAIFEFLTGKSDKIWVTLLMVVVAAGITVPMYMMVYRSLRSIVIPMRPQIHIFIPANEEGAWGDAFLQYAGFEAANAASNKEHVELRFYDSSEYSWLDKMEKCITDTPEDNPVWFVITMSDKGVKARERLDILLRKDPRLKERLTVLFTVSSSRFETLDRRNMFRLFVDGEAEAVAISEHIRSNLAESESGKKNILCYRVSSQYGKDAFNKLKKRLTNQYEIDECDEKGLTRVDIEKYEIVVAIAYDQELRRLFNFLKDKDFRGNLFGTTTLSVPDWLKLCDYDSSKITVMHTAVSGFEENAEFTESLKPITYDKIVALDNKRKEQGNGIFNIDTINEMHRNRKTYDAYKDIENNYISAFCADCVSLFALAARKGHPTLRSLLDDPTLDEDRRTLTVIRDLDFGVTGDSHVSVFLRKAAVYREKAKGELCS